MKMTMLLNLLSGAVLLTLVLPVLVYSQDRVDLEALKRERLKDGAADFWIYDDLAKGYAAAAATGKPLLVSFRCVP